MSPLAFALATLNLVSADLVPLLIRLLYPKMRKRSGRLGGKGAPGSARTAILNYLAALEPAELAPLVKLFLQPVSSAFTSAQSMAQDADHAKLENSKRCSLRFSPCVSPEWLS